MTVLSKVTDLRPGDVLSFGGSLVVDQGLTPGGSVVLRVLNTDGTTASLPFSPLHNIARWEREGELK